VKVTRKKKQHRK